LFWYGRKSRDSILFGHTVSSSFFLFNITSYFCPKLPDEVVLGMYRSLSLVGLRKEGRREEVFMSAFKV